MKKFIKLLCFVIFVFATLLLVGCKPDNPTPDPDPTPDPNPEPGLEEPVYDFMGEDFVIMVDSLTADPRHEGYQRMFQTEKTELINKVEEKYNLKVKFVQYPAEASWGNARSNYINKASATNTVRAHVYEVSSSWIGNLAVSKSISPLDEYIEKYDQGMWDIANEVGSAMGHIYGYYDNYPIGDEGIFYNVDLLEKYLGKGKGQLPSQLWLDGEWTWDKFEEMCNQLNQAMPEDYYVMGGAIYNWAYQFFGSNGVHVVDTDFKCGLGSQDAYDTVVFMNRLFNSVRWDWDVNPSNATSTSMQPGKVAFHNGQSYWIFQANKWLGHEYKIGFVPYPKGPQIKDDLSNYYINDVYGKGTYVISSAYSKDKIPEGYEDSMLHDEIIFKIWSELQYLPEIDPKTGEASVEEFVDEYARNRCEKYYAGELSVEAHKTIMSKAYPDRLFTLSNATAQNDEGYGFGLRNLIKGDINEARASLGSLVTRIQQDFKDLYSLPEDYYG